MARLLTNAESQLIQLAVVQAEAERSLRQREVDSLTAMLTEAQGKLAAATANVAAATALRDKLERVTV